MNQPRVTIVIPAYNAARYLEESLASVRALEYPGELLEAIVVDDGSTDATMAVASALTAKFPFEARVIAQANAGPSHARNTGWRQAKGEWIQFLDADDQLAPEKLAVQTSSLATADSSIACLYSPWRREDTTHDGVHPRDDRHQAQFCDPDVEGDPILELLRTENFIPVGAGLNRKDWLERVGGFNESYRFIEDVDLHLRLAIASGQLQRVPSETPLFTYRCRSDSLSQSSRLEFVRGCVRNARMAEAHWKGAAGAITETQKRALMLIYENALRAFSELDAEAFDVTLRDVKELAPRFLPTGVKLRMMSRVIGIKHAYYLSGALRNLGNRSREWKR